MLEARNVDVHEALRVCDDRPVQVEASVPSYVSSTELMALGLVRCVIFASSREFNNFLCMVKCALLCLAPASKAVHAALKHRRKNRW